MEKSKQKKSNFSLKRLISNDKYLIIVSLVLAVIVWTITSLNIGADQERTINIQVPIALGDQVSETLGMQYYSLQDTVEISVKISGAKYVVGQVEQKDFNINFDTSSVTKTGEQYIPIVISNASDGLNYTIEDYYPTQVKGYFDVSGSKTFNVEVAYNDDFVADGYTVGNPVLNDEQVVISGPKTYIDRIEKVQVNVNIDVDNPLTEPYTGEYPIEIIGTDIQTSYLTVKSKTDESVVDKVSVTLPVLRICQLPVIVTLEDQPANLPSGAITISYSPSQINAGVLETADIKEALVGTINYNQISDEGGTFTFDATTLNGITVIDGNKTVEVTVTVDDDYIKKNVSVNKEMIDVVGVPEGYTAIVKSISKSSVAVITPKSNANNITASSITMKCDVSKTNTSNSYPVVVAVNDGTSWVYSTYTATIELVKD